jgi:hypothetical protein
MFFFSNSQLYLHIFLTRFPCAFLFLAVMALLFQICACALNFACAFFPWFLALLVDLHMYSPPHSVCLCKCEIVAFPF